MSRHDRWKTTTPEDEFDDEKKSRSEEARRVERMIDDLETEGKPNTQGRGKGIDRSHDYDYDPYRP